MHIKQSMSERVFYVVNYLFLALCAVVTIFPFINILATSLSSGRAIMSGEVFLWPVEWNLSSYRTLWQDGQMFVALKNSVIITVVGTAINMVGTIMIAYPLSKKRLRGRSIITKFIVFTMLFNGGLIPNFILVKMLGLMNTYGALWFPAIVSVYNMTIMLNFFRGIPDSLEEAAQIDGANEIYILVKLILPLSMPVIATLTLFYAVGWWNNYFNVMIYITSSDKVSMTVKLMQMINTISDTMLNSGEGVQAQEKMVPEGIKAAAIVVSTVPILCVYPFLQKYFVKGVMIGSLKG